MKLSVVIPAHRPRVGHLRRVLAALHKQMVRLGDAECVLVDNGNSPALNAETYGGPWPWLRIVREERLGSAFARAAGFLASRGAVIATLDDDTVPDDHYLRYGLEFLNKHSGVGSVAGKILGEFEHPPHATLLPHLHLLGLRDHGDSPLFYRSEKGKIEYPHFAPLGVAFFRSELVKQHANILRAQTELPAPGRIGRDSVGGCEDCEVVMTTLRLGLGVAYEPSLRVTHLIPGERLNHVYLRRLARGSSTDWAKFQVRHSLVAAQPGHFLRLGRLAKHYFLLRGWTRSGRIAWETWRGRLGGLSETPAA